MNLDIKRADVWAATLEDRSGSLAQKLTALSQAGADLDFIVSRRTPEKPGCGVVFVAPLKGPKQAKAAKEAGFQKTESMHSVRIEGPNRPGVATAMSQALAQAGINLRGLSGAAVGKRFVCYLALDKTEQAVTAVKVLKQL